MSFRDACAELRIDLPNHPDHRDAQAPRTKPEFQPVSHASPADLWQEKAEKFITWSAAGLLNNHETLVWLAARGISQETAINYRLGWNMGEDGKDIYRARKAWGLPESLKDDGRPKALWIPRGIVIPYIADGVILRVRIRRPEGEPRYYVLPGSSMSTMLIERDRRAFVVVESELDAIAVAAGNTLAGAVALGSVSAKPDAETFSVLQGAIQILNALDYDSAGAKAFDWWAEHFERCARWPVPVGKDPGDAARLGIDLEQWIKVGLPPALTITVGVAGNKRNDPCIMSEGGAGSPLSGGGSIIQGSDVSRNDVPLSPLLRELYLLLKNNPTVKIINMPSRYTVLRNGKYVGGRINELVFKTPEVLDYITNHPAEEIDGGNFLENNG